MKLFNFTFVTIYMGHGVSEKSKKFANTITAVISYHILKYIRWPHIVKCEILFNTANLERKDHKFADIFCSDFSRLSIAKEIKMKLSILFRVQIILILSIVSVHSLTWRPMTPQSELPENCPIGGLESKWDFAGPIYIGRKYIEEKSSLKVGKANADTHKKLYGLYHFFSSLNTIKHCQI